MPPALRFKLLGQPPADLVEDQADQRLGAADVGRRHDEVERRRVPRPRRDRRCASRSGGSLSPRPDRDRGRGTTWRCDSTPERSFSHLFSSSRAALATTGCDAASPRCGVVIIARSVVSIGRLRIGEEIGDAGERLVRLGVEHMQDRADQQRVAGLLPVVPALQRAFGIDQHVGDVLDVAHFPFAAAHLEQRIVGGALRRWSDRTAARGRSARASRRSELQFSPLMSWTMAEPGQVSSVGTTRPTPLPRPGRREAQHMLRAVVAEIGAAPAAEQNAVGPSRPASRISRASPSARSHRS